jgi:hypothetical protein
MTKSFVLMLLSPLKIDFDFSFVDGEPLAHHQLLWSESLQFVMIILLAHTKKRTT